MSGARPPSLVRYALRRQWKWVLPVAVLVGVPLSLLLNSLPKATYSVTQGYVVAGSASAPVTSNSDRLARDFAAILRTDDAVIDPLAHAVGRSPAAVRSRLAVGYVPGAGTLVARYEATQRQEVVDVLTELDRLLSTEGVSSGGIAAGQVRPLGQPAVVKVPNRLNPFPGAGGAAALIAAVAGAVLVERMRPQVLHPAQLRELTDRPVVELTGSDAVDVLAFRMFVDGPSGVLVYALCAPESAQHFAAELGNAADALVAAGELPEEVYGTPVLAVPELQAAEPDDDTAWVVQLELPMPRGPVVEALAALRNAPDVVLVVGPVDALQATRPVVTV